MDALEDALVGMSQRTWVKVLEIPVQYNFFGPEKAVD